MPVRNRATANPAASAPTFQCGDRPAAGLPMTASFTGNLGGQATALPHFWEHTVGSGHATLALRADWQAQLKRAHDELGMRHVRFHGILCDDMGTLVEEGGQFIYSFFNADQIFDFLLSIGMRPFVELSFMPWCLSSSGQLQFHYRANVSPPRDLSQWSTLIEKIVTHWVERYGLDEVREWFFEVWNEPNLTAFGSGKQENYFPLYRYTVEAIKNVDNQLKVGGPATADNAWVADFLAFCRKNALAVDFISTHHYPTDSFGKPGDDTETELADSKRSVLRDEAREVREGRRHAGVLHRMVHLVEPARLHARRSLRRSLHREDGPGTKWPGTGIQLLDLLGHLRGELLPFDAVPGRLWPAHHPRHPQTRLPCF
jgi:hypothetical protein